MQKTTTWMKRSAFVILAVTFLVLGPAGQVDAGTWFSCYWETLYSDGADLQLCGFFQSGTACSTLLSECDFYCSNVLSYSYGDLYLCWEYSGGNYADAACFCY